MQICREPEKRLASRDYSQQCRVGPFVLELSPHPFNAIHRFLEVNGAFPRGPTRSHHRFTAEFGFSPPTRISTQPHTNNQTPRQNWLLKTLTRLPSNGEGFRNTEQCSGLSFGSPAHRRLWTQSPHLIVDLVLLYSLSPSARRLPPAGHSSRGIRSFPPTAKLSRKMCTVVLCREVPTDEESAVWILVLPAVERTTSIFFLLTTVSCRYTRYMDETRRILLRNIPRVSHRKCRRKSMHAQADDRESNGDARF